MDSVESFEVQIATVYYIERTWLDNKQVQDVDVVYFSFGNMDEFRDAAAQIQKGMKFDGSLGLAEFCPGKEFQTQVYGGGVESVGRLLQLDSEIFVCIKRSGYPNQYLSEIRVNTPISGFVGSGQGASGNPASNTHMVKSWLHCSQAGFDIAQAFAIGKLGKSHSQKLV